MGLLLALASYLILNTINPKLVNNTFDVSGVNVGVTQFTFSGVNEVYTTTNGVKTKVNSLKLAELFPHAKTVSLSTGVPITTILGILQVETHLNTGDGGCVWDAPGVMRSDNVRDDKAAYQQIIATIPGATVNDHKVSCPVAGIVGYGGGMGASQHIPTTWKGLTPAIKAASGKNYADPWDLDDAIYALAVHIKNDGGISDPQNAACKYYSGHACGTQQADSQPNGNLTYRDRFNSAVAAIQAEITKQNLQ